MWFRCCCQRNCSSSSRSFAVALVSDWDQGCFSEFKQIRVNFEMTHCYLPLIAYSSRLVSCTDSHFLVSTVAVDYCSSQLYRYCCITVARRRSAVWCLGSDTSEAASNLVKRLGFSRRGAGPGLASCFQFDCCWPELTSKAAGSATDFQTRVTMVIVAIMAIGSAKAALWIGAGRSAQTRAVTTAVAAARCGTIQTDWRCFRACQSIVSFMPDSKMLMLAIHWA